MSRPHDLLDWKAVEFRHRTRLIDIGRSSWLLEAVRDAQERNKELPADLLKELSRNLFADQASTALDGHLQAAADILLQGLSSQPVKSPDGAKVEAKRGNDQAQVTPISEQAAQRRPRSTRVQMSLMPVALCSFGEKCVPSLIQRQPSTIGCIFRGRAQVHHRQKHQS